MPLRVLPSVHPPVAAREEGGVGVGAEVGWGGGMGWAWRNGYVVVVDRFYIAL